MRRTAQGLVAVAHALDEVVALGHMDGPRQQRRGLGAVVDDRHAASGRGTQQTGQKDEGAMRPHLEVARWPLNG